MAAPAAVYATDPMQVASATNTIGSSTAGLNLASTALNIAAIPFNTVDAMKTASTQAQNAAASAEALKIERDRTLHIFDRESRQLAANQTVAYIMSGLDTGGGGTVSNVQQVSAQERQADRNAINLNYGIAISNAKRAEKAAKESGKNALIGGVAQAAGMAAGLAMFSDERLKRGLIAVGRARNGLKIYLGRYTPESGLDDGCLHLFLIAQEVQKIRPDAVKVADNGFLMVDYAAALL